MKVATSYFYRIRFFTPNMIPLSTAVWDPKWYHRNKDQGYTFVDTRGVINGLRVPAMAPGPTCSDLCRGNEGCLYSPDSCAFLKHYRAQLEALNCDDYMRRVNNLLLKMKGVLEFDEEPVAVFIVHEAPANVCSERVPIQEWLTSHGYPCTELDYTVPGIAAYKEL